MYSVSSFKLDLEPKPKAYPPIDIAEQSKISLDSLFHPGGESKPLQPWFAVRVTGVLVCWSIYVCQRCVSVFTCASLS